MENHQWFNLVSDVTSTSFSFRFTFCYWKNFVTCCDNLTNVLNFVIDNQFLTSKHKSQSNIFSLNKKLFAIFVYTFWEMQQVDSEAVKEGD